ALAIGFAIGTFPILGTHTILGIFIAMLLGLNQVAVYLGAWLSAPAYVLLLLPSLRTGEFLLKSENMDLDKFITNLKRMFHSFHDFTEVGVIYGQSIVHIIIGWLPYAIVLSFLMYFISLSFARLLMKKKNN
ncbi:MAG: DUF2062 domain-containing protein, partial [Spirochaetia bacterium]|nr:DUF2062 domain-containing protein [Spirochaetia bacterium]